MAEVMTDSERMERLIKLVQQIPSVLSRVEQEAYERGYTKAFVDSNEKLVRVAQKSRQSTLEEVRGMIEGVKKEGEGQFTPPEFRGLSRRNIWNKALTTLQEKLKNK